MNFKCPAKLRVEKSQFVLDFNGQDISSDNIGWISKHLDRILDHLLREYYPITEDDYILIMEEDGNCYLETTEVRNKAKSWEGSAINSFSTEDPVYREEIMLIENKMILHFYRKGDKNV